MTNRCKQVDSCKHCQELTPVVVVVVVFVIRRGQGSVEGTATRYGLDRPVFEHRWG